VADAVVTNALVQARRNYARLLVLVTEAVANPTQANVDAITTALATTGKLTAKPTYSMDGKSYDWAGYQRMLLDQIAALDEAIVRSEGPWEIVSRGVT
jgi:hypothetical protein